MNRWRRRRLFMQMGEEEFGIFPSILFTILWTDPACNLWLLLVSFQSSHPAPNMLFVGISIIVQNCFIYFSSHSFGFLILSQFSQLENNLLANRNDQTIYSYYRNLLLLGKMSSRFSSCRKTDSSSFEDEYTVKYMDKSA